MTIVLQGHVTSADKSASDYRLLAFTVPEGTQRIEVCYTFERDAGNIIDLGLFDPRGADFLRADGFRGWSGSDRAHVVVTARSATPGYLPGPLFPGTWHVILGLYKIQPEGCPYRVEITLSEEEGELPTPIPPAEGPSFGLPPYNGGGRGGPAWFKGDLQSHTHHSDGRASVAELATVARGRELDFLAVTDHNTVSHHRELLVYSRPDLLLIPGQEVTTYYGHANVWGLDRWLDFRCRTDEEMRLIIDEAHRRGLLFSVNHPKDTGTPWTYNFDLPFDCMEVWQGLWPWLNHESLTYWERLLMKGRRVIAVGGSDKHQERPGDGLGFHQLGQPTTWVFAQDLTVEAILAGIRAGHVFISADVDGPQLVLTARAGGGEALMGDELAVPPGELINLCCEVTRGTGGWLRLISGGQTVAQAEVPRHDFVWETTLSLPIPGYIRAELAARAPDPASHVEMLALTNPVYLV